MSAVEVHNLRKEFGRTSLRRGGKRTAAVDGVSFEIARGECVAVLGRNGSGKSTLVRILSTLILPDGGSASIFGHDVVEDAGDVRRLVNRVSVEASFFKKMSPVENLSYAARFYGLGIRETRRRIPRSSTGSASRLAARLADGATLARDAAEGRARPGLAHVTGCPAPRRADDRPRSALEARGAGVHRGHPRPSRHDDPALHPRHARGGGALGARRHPRARTAAAPGAGAGVARAVRGGVDRGGLPVHHGPRLRGRGPAGRGAAVEEVAK